MNIYDEAKVITHEQARKQIQSTNEYLETNIDPFGSFETYINQQEKKDERAKKVEELLGLVNAKCDFLVYIMNGAKGLQEIYMSLLSKIDILEKELEEMK